LRLFQGFLCPPWVDKGWGPQTHKGLQKCSLPWVKKNFSQNWNLLKLRTSMSFQSLFSPKSLILSKEGETEITNQIPEKFFTSSTQWQQATKSSSLLKMSSSYKSTKGHTIIFALCYSYTSYKSICTVHNNSIFFKSMPSNEVVKGNDVFNLPIRMIDSGGKIMKPISLIHSFFQIHGSN
jgi:hypothetical protein